MDADRVTALPRNGRRFSLNVGSEVKSFLRSHLREDVLAYARSSFGRYFNQIQFRGDFKTWDEAEQMSLGYDDNHILHKTAEAVRKVIRGDMVFERDGVAFPVLEYNFPLVWALTRSAALRGRLHVLDFGGALGSTYLQSRPLLQSIPDIKWAIIEQAGHVEIGNAEVANVQLRFYQSVESACNEDQYDVLLLSGVIQYLPDPLAFLETVLKHQPSAVIVDRTPFMVNGVARLTVQHVPNTIYRASYPAWFLSEAEFLARFAGYERIATWPAIDKHHPQGGRAEYRGFLFELRMS